MTARSGKPIALGRTAEIFAWDNEHILKLYRDWCPRDWVEYELKIGRIVQDAGLPVPRLGDLIEVDGRRGIVYERVDGVSMARMFQAKPWLLLHFARLLAELHAAIHACPVPADFALPARRIRTRDSQCAESAERFARRGIARARRDARWQSTLSRRFPPGQCDDDRAWSYRD
jgi:Ser/Thr protein kinase RdoA (MazF antagonist)